MLYFARLFSIAERMREASPRWRGSGSACLSSIRRRSAQIGK